MFLLPLLTGFLLVFQGHGYSAHGSRNTAARELEDFNQFLDGLSSKYRQILDVQRKRQQEYKQRIDDPEWSDLSQDVNFDHKDVPRDGINFAAADVNDDPPKVDPVEETKYDVNQKQNDGTVKPDTSTSTSTPALTDDQPQAHKLVASPRKPGNGVDAIGRADFLFIVVVSACSVAGLIGLIMAGVCWYKLHRRVKAASDVDYPAYGVTGPTKERLPSPGDRKLAQSAQMYHYQHQKQQMIAMEKANGEMKQDGSEDESEEENEEGDYTVYECPGLAPTGEMEVRNPLFTEETQTPVNGQPVSNGLPDDKEQE